MRRGGRPSFRCYLIRGEPSIRFPVWRGRLLGRGAGRRFGHDPRGHRPGLEQLLDDDQAEGDAIISIQTIPFFAACSRWPGTGSRQLSIDRGPSLPAATPLALSGISSLTNTVRSIAARLDPALPPFSPHACTQWRPSATGPE